MMYYVILPAQMLDTVLPQEIKQYCNYDKDYTLREAAFVCRELEDGNWLVSCKLCNYQYIANKCVLEEMTDVEIEMAKSFYGAENLIEDISNLKFKENEIS